MSASNAQGGRISVMFTVRIPTLDNHWRSIILFGRNVASYKFALAKSLLELAGSGKTDVSIDELAVPFSKHITDHLKKSDKQGTSSSSKFLAGCREFNNGKLSESELIELTARFGFVNVIDAFHVVNNSEIPIRFFQPNSDKSRISLTDELLKLKDSIQFGNLDHEVESRWRLVETAWDLNLSRNLVNVEYDSEAGMLVTPASYKRVCITSSRNALNGYQKGKCFYCFTDLSLDAAALNADVDHFFPHTLKTRQFKGIDGVWNLVLSCNNCNRGAEGKFACIPDVPYLERLANRNNFLINSHHPLRETLIAQTGTTDSVRVRFLNQYYNAALAELIHTWRPRFELEAAF
jgi:hypothetical protein